jgi:hypothetical protein
MKNTNILIIISVVVSVLVLLWFNNNHSSPSVTPEYTKDTLPVLRSDSNTAVATDDTIGYKMIPMHDGTIMFPIITSFRDEKIKDKVNQQLQDFADDAGCYTMKDSQDDLRSFATLFLRIDQFASQNVDSLSVSQLKKIIIKNSTYTIDTQVTYAKNDILSLKITMSNSCGGAYPNDGIDQSITFDMRTGEIVPFYKLFIQKYYVENIDDPSNKVGYIDGVLNDVFSGLFDKTAATSDYASSCVGGYQTQNEGIPETAYNISEKKEIRISYQFAHAIAACNQEITVPIKSLSKFFDSRSILSRIQ